MRFLGNIEAKTDTKGRAFLPASFRKVLTASGEDTLVLRQDVFENLLVLYPQRVWNQLMDDMRSRLSRWDRKQQMAFRTLVGTGDGGSASTATAASSFPITTSTPSAWCRRYGL